MISSPALKLKHKIEIRQKQGVPNATQKEYFRNHIPFSLLPIQHTTIFTSCPSEREVVTVPRTSEACDSLPSLTGSLSLRVKTESKDTSSTVAFLMLPNEWHHVTSSAHHGRPAELWGFLTNQEVACACH